MEISEIKERFNKIANTNLDKGKTMLVIIEDIMRPFIDQLRDTLRLYIHSYLEKSIPSFKVLSSIEKILIDPHFDYMTLSNEDFQNMS